MDSEGRTENKPRAIKAAAFPYDDLTASDITRMLAEIDRAGLIRLYDAGGQALIWIPSFRAAEVTPPGEPPSTLPPAAEDLPFAVDFDLSPPGSPTAAKRVRLATGTDPRDAWFEAFWTAYWRKIAKADARKVYMREVKTGDLRDRILAAIKEQTPTMLSRTPDKIPHASTWLNQRRWEDEVDGAAGVPVPCGGGPDDDLPWVGRAAVAR